MDLQSTAALVTIGAAAVGVAGWAIRRRQRARDPLAAKLAPLECELIPIWFEVSLVHNLPQVMVTLQAVNYLNKELAIDRATVEYFHLNQGPPLEDIPASDVAVPPRQSREVYCRRKLLDSEIRAFGNCPEDKQYEATIRVSMKGHAGKRAISYRPGTNLRIHGHYQRYGWREDA